MGREGFLTSGPSLENHIDKSKRAKKQFCKQIVVEPYSCLHYLISFKCWSFNKNMNRGKSFKLS